MPTNPLTFIGVPDWRSAVLALVYAAPWLVLLAGRRLRRPWLWVVFALGALLFSISIAWVQVPVQQALNALYVQTLPTETIRRYLLALAIPPVFVAGLVQELVKFGLGIVGLYLIHARHTRRAASAMGAAAGAGYGAAEAFWVFNQVFAAGFTWATVQLGGISALLPFIERFFTVMFHTGVASVAVYGFASGRTWRYLWVAIGLHTLTDYLAALVQQGIVSIIASEVVIGIIAVATLALALWLRFHPRRTPQNAA